MRYLKFVEFGMLVAALIGIGAIVVVAAAVLVARAIGYLMAVSWDQFLTTCAERFHRC